MANYQIQSCDGLISLTVNSNLDELISGNTYYITFTGETNPGCFTVGKETGDIEEDGISSVIGYTDCLECFQEAPNTETIICQEVCDLSGGTRTVSVTPPHPVWTDGFGTQVTQLNMVTLGGVNGLNS